MNVVGYKDRFVYAILVLDDQFYMNVVGYKAASNCANTPGITLFYMNVVGYKVMHMTSAIVAVVCFI